jgi:hypothetical protein
VRLRAVVVDERWWVAVGQGALPQASVAPGEAPADALQRALGLSVEIVAPLGPDTFVCRALQGQLQPALQWWPPSRAMKELSLPEEQHLVKKAMGPC